MRVARRTNLLWGLVFLGAALIWLLAALDVLPPAIADLVGRAWPVLLVLVGLSILLRDRVPFGSVVALVVCVALVAGVTASAFSTRATQSRDAYQQPISQLVGENVNLLHVQVVTLETDVELVRSLDARSITGQFAGSTESELVVNYAEGDDNTATLTVTETRPNQFPMLEAIGRGRLHLELPSNIPVDVNVDGQSGLVSLNMSDMAVERLNLDWQQGDALVTLPEYDPQGSPDDAVLGALVVADGDITLFVPQAAAARFELNRGSSGLNPVFDPLLYNYLVGDILESRSYDSAAIKMHYIVTAPRGLITVSSAATP